MGILGHTIKTIQDMRAIMTEQIRTETIALPFSRIVPYAKGKNPFSMKDYPNEPHGWITIPVFVWPTMEREDILLEAIRIRDNLIDKWFNDRGGYPCWEDNQH